jgi:hypothetical protein
VPHHQNVSAFLQGFDERFAMQILRERSSREPRHHGRE